MALLLSVGAVKAQNMNDHKFSFQYIQLPYFHIDDKFTSYDLNVIHNYVNANADSTNLFQIRQDASKAVFESMMQQYMRDRDSITRVHLRNMAAWEKKVNAGTMNADGTPIAQPVAPIYPVPPFYPQVEQPFLHSALDKATVDGKVNIEGYKKGTNGFTVTLTFNPIQIQSPVESKSGTGATIKYTYQMPYSLPIGVRVESPTQGVIFEEILFQGRDFYNLGSYASKYEFDLYYMDNKAKAYRDIETYARNKALNEITSYLNSQVGYMLLTRQTELYSVKKHKDYEYSDVTNAYTLTTQALSMVKNDRNRKTAMSKIDQALEAIESILAESNVNDEKARINDKVTAMLQCNKAELLIWRAEFDAADSMANIALNSGVTKAKSHMKDMVGFYTDQRNRWKANY